MSQGPTVQFTLLQLCITPESWLGGMEIGEAGQCYAGGYWALPLQWLTMSIVNNEFLDGEAPRALSSKLQSKRCCCHSEHTIRHHMRGSLM